MNSSDDDFDNAPVLWNAPQPAVQEVTEQQKREFEKTYASIQNQLNNLISQKQQLKSQHQKLKKDASDLVAEKKLVDNEIKSCIQETEDIRNNLNKKPPAKPRTSNKNDFTAQKESLEFSSINNDIKRVRGEIDKLKTKYNEELRLWKGEKNRLTNLLQEQQNECNIMKQSIEQFRSYLREKNSSDLFFEEEEDENKNEFSSRPASSPIRVSPKEQQELQKYQEMLQLNPKEKQQEKPTEKYQENYKEKRMEIDIKPNPDSKLYQFLSSSAESSPVQSPVQSPARSNVKSYIQGSNKTTPHSPIKKIVSPPTFTVQKVREFMPPMYKLDFNYHPIGEPKATTTLKNGRESLYENGDRYIEYRNRTQKITRRDGTVYILFPNDDVSKEFPDGVLAYYFGETGAIQLTLPDQTTHTVFTNGQKEINFTNGDKYIIFPDESTKYTKANGDYQVRFPNGKTQTCVNGVITSS
ncbi:hypothetical protein TRFO_17449 [Tritrichomonas foetus]|uniref:Centromere protein J C-terminal domain-containing protein n=1 Tax=Tritrichomonas foetus TaxID=1144522 RepID=A0A1J4KMU4_9EUKA|nr:hypothetical protein TRFO_17449 [Tritrichomonas foetus]|eukprot:OHT12633.1 hypothetical protein TRFO_17449 [Tritrichomonas foetus]